MLFKRLTAHPGDSPPPPGADKVFTGEGDCRLNSVIGLQLRGGFSAVRQRTHPVGRASWRSCPAETPRVCFVPPAGMNRAR